MEHPRTAGQRAFGLRVPGVRALPGAVPLRGLRPRLKEKGCAIRAAVKAGDIQKGRHDSYIRLYAVAKEFKAWEKKPGRPIK